MLGPLLNQNQLTNSVVMWIGVSDKRHTNRYSDGQTDTERDMDMNREKQTNRQAAAVQLRHRSRLTSDRY